MTYHVRNAEVNDSSLNCGISFNNGDIVFDDGGHLIFVSGTHKLAQKIQRELSLNYIEDEDRGNKIFTTLEEFKQESSQTIIIMLKKDIFNALYAIQSKQTSAMPLEEQIQSIDTLNVYLADGDVSTALIEIAVTNYKQEKVVVPKIPISMLLSLQ